MSKVWLVTGSATGLGLSHRVDTMPSGMATFRSQSACGTVDQR